MRAVDNEAVQFEYPDMGDEWQYQMNVKPRSAYNDFVSVLPLWTTITVFIDGEYPTYPARRLCESDSGLGQQWLCPTKLGSGDIASGPRWHKVAVWLAVG